MTQEEQIYELKKQLKEEREHKEDLKEIKRAVLHMEMLLESINTRTIGKI